MTPWQQLTAAALLGTERQDFAPPPLPESLSRLPATETSSEGSLLTCAAALTLYQDAGRTTAPADDLPLQSVAPAEKKPIIVGARVGLLQQTLEEPYIAVLDEVLQRIVDLDQLVPPEMIPAVFAAGCRSKSLRPAAANVAGQRGQWLAKQNADWKWALAETASPDAELDFSAWDEGTPQERLAFLKSCASVDRAKARELILEARRSEQARTRLQFIELLGDGICTDDEALLEEFLDDRSKEVSLAACELLARIPTSAFAARMKQRLLACLEWKRKLLGRELIVKRPEALDPAMERDGIGRFSTYTNVSNRDRWFLDIIRCSPLDTWTEFFGKPISAVLAALEKHESMELLVSGIGCALPTQRRNDWTMAVLESDTFRNKLHSAGLLRFVVGAIPAAQYEPWLVKLLAAVPRDERLRHLEVFGVEFRWGSDLTIAVARALIEFLPTVKQTYHYGSQHAAALLGRCGNPDVYTEVIRLLQPVLDKEDSPRFLESPLQLYDFRHQVAKEFTK